MIRVLLQGSLIKARKQSLVRRGAFADRNFLCLLPGSTVYADTASLATESLLLSLRRFLLLFSVNFFLLASLVRFFSYSSRLFSSFFRFYCATVARHGDCSHRCG